MNGIEPIKAILFDWEGTLSECVYPMIQMLRAFAKLHQLTLVGDESTLRQRFMIHSSISLHVFCLEDVSEHISAAWRQKMAFFYESAVHPTTDAFLRSLKTKGYRLGIVSSKGRKALMHDIDALCWSDLFDVVESGPKPDPHLLYSASEFWGLPPEACVMIGDHPVDILMAKKANMASIGVLSGHGSLEALKAIMPDCILHQISNISSLGF